MVYSKSSKKIRNISRILETDSENNIIMYLDSTYFHDLAYNREEKNSDEDRLKIYNYIMMEWSNSK